MKYYFTDDQLKSLESEFAFMLEHRVTDPRQSMVRIASILKTGTGKNINVSLVQSKTSTVYAMSVSPSRQALDNLVNDIMNKAFSSNLLSGWSKIMDWHILIDSRLLYGSLPFTPKELTVMLLHEVGHVMQSDTIFARFSRMMSQLAYRSGFVMRQVIGAERFSKLLSLPLINAGSTSRHKNIRQCLKEIEADKFAFLQGDYRNDLISALEKVIQLQSRNPQTTAVSEEEEMSQDFKNVEAIIVGLKGRKDLLTKPLYELRPIKRVPYDVSVTEMKRDLGCVNRKEYLYLCEYTEKLFYKYTEKMVLEDVKLPSYYSEAFTFFHRKLKPVGMDFVAYAREKLAEIETEDDKLMLLSYLEDKISVIDWYLFILANPMQYSNYIVPQSAPALEAVKKEMLSTMALIEKARTPGNKYDSVQQYLDIQVPKGYEG